MKLDMWVGGTGRNKLGKNDDGFSNMAIVPFCKIKNRPWKLGGLKMEGETIVRGTIFLMAILQED